MEGYGRYEVTSKSAKGVWGLMVILLSLAMIQRAASAATTHYISSSLGSDTNNGTAKATAWAHAPGMPTCTGNCAGYTPQPGDQFIFYGGDTWGVSNFQWDIGWSGTSGNSIYFGADKTWYNSSVCGVSFCQPIFDPAFTLISPTCSGEGCALIDFGGVGAVRTGVSYIAIDNFQIQHFEMRNNKDLGYTGYRSDVFEGYNAGYTEATHITISNNTIKDWGMDGTISPGSSNSGIGLLGTGNILSGNTISDQNGSCSGYPTGCIVGGGLGVSGGSIVGNTCEYVDVCIESYNAGDVIAGNVIHDTLNSIDPNQHGDAIHANCAAYIYDNVIYNMASGVAAVLNEPRNSSCTAVNPQTYYTWNNVMWGLGNQTCFEDRDYSGITVNYVHYNDTCVAPGSGGGGVSSYAVRIVKDHIAQNPVGPSSELVVNMHVITATRVSRVAPFLADASLGSCCMTPPNGETVTTSIAMTPSVAARLGYISANMFAPASGSIPTVKQGTNLTTHCSGNLLNLCTALSMSAPGKSGSPRPAMGNWNVGAYQISGTGIRTHRHDRQNSRQQFTD